MASVNKIILVGNCGRDPEIRHLPSGSAVANVSIATSTKRKDKASGEWLEETQWHRVTFFDKLAEIVGQYVKKGRPLYVEGRIVYRKYTDKDGNEKQITEIKVQDLQLLGGKPDGAGGGQAPAAAQRPAQRDGGRRGARRRVRRAIVAP